MRSRDPTRSAGLRKHGRALVNRRVYSLSQRLRQVLQEHDVVGLRDQDKVAAATLFINWMESASHKLARAEGAIQDLIEQTLLVPQDWPRDLIERSVAHGIALVETELRTSLAGLDAGEVSRLHAVASVVEIRGIASETERRLLRLVVRALETKAKPEALMRDVRKVMEKITRLRLHLMVNTGVVRAVNAGKLFAYQELGFEQVGIDPEWMPHHTHQRDAVVGDHHHNGVDVLLDARTKKAKRRKRVRENKQKRKREPKKLVEEEILREGLQVLIGGSAGELAAEALEAISEATEEPVELVNILTAGDDKVCQQCEDLATDGPYDIDTAKGLIPAHPNCRCAFIPFGDKRFAPIMEQEEEF